jgi:hypothetical protein
MALAAFAPCVLLPEWRAFQAMRRSEQVEAHRVETLQRVVDRERRLLEGLQTDPGVVERLAQRGLGFEAMGSRSVRVPIAADEVPPEPTFSPTPVLPPAPLAAAARYLPELDYDGVFCETQSRTVIMVMSCALMVVGVCLPSRRSA